VLKSFRKEAVEEDDRKPERNQRRRVAKAPGESKLAGAGSGTLTPARDECRYGGEVIRVGRVAKTEQRGDAERDQERGVVGDCRESLVEPEH
jgi:hypothetical protein